MGDDIKIELSDYANAVNVVGKIEAENVNFNSSIPTSLRVLDAQVLVAATQGLLTSAVAAEARSRLVEAGQALDLPLPTRWTRALAALQSFQALVQGVPALVEGASDVIGVIQKLS